MFIKALNNVENEQLCLVVPRYNVKHSMFEMAGFIKRIKLFHRNFFFNLKREMLVLQFLSFVALFKNSALSERCEEKNKKKDLFLNNVLTYQHHRRRRRY